MMDMSLRVSRRTTLISMVIEGWAYFILYGGPYGEIGMGFYFLGTD